MSTSHGALADTVIRRTIELAEVPAPTGAEGARAGLVRSWWAIDGLAEVHLDEAGNVWGRARAGDGSAVVVCAHLDTVFGPEVPHTVRTDADRLSGPSVGDDSIGVAALSAVASLLSPHGVPVWLLATVGEEGLGNLRGATSALEAPPQPVGAFLAVEGNYLGRVSTVGVGSVRRRVRVLGPGGHAWEAADAPSAIHGAADLIAGIGALPRVAGTSVNVGRIGGGEGINVRAREAWFELDLRADDPEALAALVGRVEDVLAGVEEPLHVEQEVLGERPAGRVDSAHPLVRAAEEALREADVEVISPATSTDANAAHARGIAAVALGVTTGSGEHTAQEWIETRPIDGGVRALARTLARYGELRG
ncbi:MAG: M20/M25/M40 family metallo-hydrolase [Actinomycetota bacterium]